MHLPGTSCTSGAPAKRFNPAFARLPRALGSKPIHYFACHICESITPPLVFERKFFMIQSHQVKNGCMKIVHVHRVFCDVIAEVICFAIYTWPYTATGHPDGKAAWMMIPAIIFFKKLTLAIICSSKLTAPDHQC